MTSRQIRIDFLAFFTERGHTIVPSASVIPIDDPTLLFTNAGMNQFKDVFLGTGRREYVRAADSQKCIRVSGKHNDLEEVGRDTYHHTFFEMLGNWSFGDYYKKEAISWAWELLTKVWGLDKRRLYATVFETDYEAEEFWKSETDIDHSHILRFGRKYNFWEMGETGPCGPCSEIHIDLTSDYSGGALVNAGDARVMEIWNLVFIQYNRDDKGSLTPLPAKHVDTGMGFERICAVLQGKKSNYDTDVFLPVIKRIAEVTGTEYHGSLEVQSSSRESQSDIAMRVIADHVRMLAFSIADGGIPSNEGRGYVMRRILRRAARFGRNLGVKQPFIFNVVGALADSMGDQYPELRERLSHIERVIRGEEESFNATLDRGLEIFDSVLKEIGASKIFPGEDAFKLYDTFGFPLDLTQLMAQERGLEVDATRFDELMDEQRVKARGARRVQPIEVRSTEGPRSHGTGGIGLLAPEDVKRMDFSSARGYYRFIGYESLASESELLFVDKNVVVLKESPFYGESGGQVGDTGILQLGDSRNEVWDTRKQNDCSVILMKQPVQWTTGMRIRASVDEARRRSIERNHTATHIVHEALRRVLGTHAHQQGSLVAPDHLRFDFNHFEKITADQLRTIEEIVNEKISENIAVMALNDPNEWLTIEEAKRKYPNVKMFFGDKYGDRVRIVEIDPQFSVELCGGTHVRRTQEIGLFKIVSEASIASGIRRIEAVTGEGLNTYIRKRMTIVGELDAQLEKLMREKEALEKELGKPQGSEHPKFEGLTEPVQASRESLGKVDLAEKRRLDAIDAQTKIVHELKKEASKNRVRDAASEIDALVAGGVAVDGFKVVSAKIEVGDAEELKRIGDTLRERIASGVGVLAAVVDEKVALVCVVTDDLIKGKKLQAGKIVGELARRVGGGGGGRPHLATAGGKDVGKLDEALGQAAEIVKGML